MRFDVRLRMRVPGAAESTARTLRPASFSARITPIDGGLEMSISRRIYNVLPAYMEMSLEYFKPSTLTWVEPENARWLVLTTNGDDADQAQIVSLTSVDQWQYFAGKAVLLDRLETVGTNISASGGFTLTGINKTGVMTFVKTAHGLVVGNQVQVSAAGKCKGVKRWSKYYVVWVDGTGNQFRLSSARGGTALKHGGYTGGLVLRRIVDRFTLASNPFNNGDKVQFSDVGGGNLTVGKDYFISRSLSGSFGVALTPGGRLLDVGTSTNADVARVVDGKRAFNNLTPGSLVRTAVVEAQTRGWGTWLAIDFNSTLSSSGASWPTAITWPVNMGSTTKDLIDLVMSFGLARARVLGRTLRLLKPLGDPPGGPYVRIGVAASGRPVQTSIANLTTAATVAGKGTARATVENPAAVTALGRLEVYETSDTPILSNAALRADHLLEAGETPDMTLTVTYSPEVPTSKLPFIDFVDQQWVQAKVATVWTVVQANEIAIRKDDARVVTIDVTLGTKQQAYLARLAKAQALAKLRADQSRAARQAAKAKAAKAKKKKK